MTREIMIPQSYVRVINTKKARKTTVRKSAAAVSVSGRTANVSTRSAGKVQAGKTSAVKTDNKRNTKTSIFSELKGLLIKAGRVLFAVLYAVIYAALSVADAFNFAWLCIQEKCGEIARKVGTEGLFGEVKDGYYHTEDGFRLHASAITVKPRKEKRL